MAGLRKIGILSNKLFVNKIPAIYITRNCTTRKQLDKEMFELQKPPALKKYMPGFYPETEEERIKAAEKYGMHPSDYKPLPNDHRHAGDYPDLPWISVEAKDPFYPWDYPHLRRNFEEPVHLNFDLMGDDRYEYGVRKLISDTKGAFLFFATMVVVFILHHISPSTSLPTMEKQYPRDGVHYTFEPAE